tara:strand:- start:9307 stop:10407 length:1101 start_codon:yes stop_codon:yes gene_type:complete
MTHSYTWVQWNPHKKTYDLVLALLCVFYLAAFVAVSTLTHQGEHQLSIMLLLTRAFSTLALILLHIILCIGPLSRFTTLVAPLLYNRRHLGVTMALAALAHSALVILYYGGFGDRFPLAAAVDGYQSFTSISGFPFEVLGLLALLIIVTMAATSHDFWLSFLTPRTWKTLHMLVYIAYALTLAHVFLGFLQSEQSPILSSLLIAGAALVTTLHLLAGLYERKRDTTGLDPATDSADPDSNEPTWIDIGAINDFEPDVGRVICLKQRERVAVFRHNNTLSAMSNVCAHQGGPLGEGQIVDGCVTCPWHGYQYLPESGQSPPPYHEKIPTYELHIQGTRVMLNPTPNAPGTPVDPAAIPVSVEDQSNG